MKKRLIKFILWFSGTLLLFTGAFFILNHQLYNGRLTDSDDGITVLQNITLDKISSTDIIGSDSIWVMRENMEAEANGIIIDTMGNYNGVIQNGIKQGKWRYFYPNNRKLSELYYIDGYYGNHLRNEQYGQKRTKEKVPLSIISEVGLNGKCMFWYENGQLLKVQNYKDGKRFENGVYKEWDYNGDVKLEQEFQDGRAQGLYREWYNNLLIIEGQYLDYKKDGLWKYWNREGSLELEANWLNGKKNGLWKYWNREAELNNLLIQLEENWLNDKKHGNCFAYNYVLSEAEVDAQSHADFIKGNLETNKKIYHNGKLISFENYISLVQPNYEDEDWFWYCTKTGKILSLR